jgi:hypothetical protein
MGRAETIGPAMPSHRPTDFSADALASELAASRGGPRLHREDGRGLTPGPVGPRAASEHDDRRNDVEQSPEAIQRRVRQSAMVPDIITIACPEGHAPVGQHCYDGPARGVCWRRVVARVAVR